MKLYPKYGVHITKENPDFSIFLKLLLHHIESGQSRSEWEIDFIV